MGCGAVAAVVGEALAAASAAFGSLGAGAAGALGLADATLGGVTAGSLIGGGLEGATIGALGGGLIDAATGKPILPGMLEGGLTGAAIGGLGPAVGGLTGLGSTAGSAIAGAGGGALGSAAKSGNVLQGAEMGGVSGLASGLMSGGSTPSASSGVSTTGSAVDASNAIGASAPISAGGPSAAAIAAPAGVGSGAPVDLTSGLNLDATTSAPGVLPSGEPAGAASGLGLGSGGGITQEAAAGLPSAVAPGTGFPTPPVPPSLDASGNPILSPSGSPTYPNAAAAQAAATQEAADVSGFPTQAVASPSLLQQAGDFVGSSNGKLAGAAISGLGLAKNLMTPNSTPGLSQIQSLANSSAAQGQILQGYLTSGTLPPAIQASINAATKDGITAIKAKYAGMGVAPGSSAETQDIARLQQNSVIQGATLADQLLQQGISETQLSGQLYNDLVNYNTALNQQTGTAISSLASALAGGGTTVKLA